MTDMDYLIDGLSELYSDESLLSPKTMTVWYDKLTAVTKVIEEELKLYNYDSQKRITSALQNIILRTQFSCMCVYSHYKSYPGLIDCLVGTDKRMRLIASTGDLKTFCELFYKENVDNNVLTTIQRIYKYVEFLIECAVSDLISSDNLEKISIVTKRIARTIGKFPDLVKNDMDKIDDMISYDLMEYTDNDRIVSMLDDLCVHDYENLMMFSNDKLEQINNMVKDRCKARVVLSLKGLNGLPITDDYNYIFNQADIDMYKTKGVHYEVVLYLKNIQHYTKGLTDEEVNEYAQYYISSLVQVGYNSVLSRYVEHLVLQTRDYFKIAIDNPSDPPEDAFQWLKTLIKLWILLTDRIL